MHILFERTWRILLPLIALSSIYYLTDYEFPSPGDFAIAVNQVRLGNLDGQHQSRYYNFIQHANGDKVTIALFGHIYDLKNQLSYLTNPVLSLEEKDPANGLWKTIKESRSSISGVEVVRLQNLTLSQDKNYRIKVGTNAETGGRYALIVDQSYPECEFELEELDFGGNGPIPWTMASAYVAKDELAQYGAKILVGTNQGTVIESVDDGSTWKVIYPPEGMSPLDGPVYGILQDSAGIIYISPWLPGQVVNQKHINGYVLESRDSGKTWAKAFNFQYPTGVGWRMIEDQAGNVFIGEYTSTPNIDNPPPQFGNIWRRKNHGFNGESYEVVFSNPSVNPDTIYNHVHSLAEDPYTHYIYAAIGDGSVGRFIRSKQHGDPGTWETLETGVDSQYTALTFTPCFGFLGQDTNHPFKKIVLWDKTKERVNTNEPFVTSVMMDNISEKPVRWADKGNWFWGRYDEDHRVAIIQYLPYGIYDKLSQQMQAPRLYAWCEKDRIWRRVVTFPPTPKRKNTSSFFWGPKNASNIGPNGWIYATPAVGNEEIHRGFRIRIK